MFLGRLSQRREHRTQRSRPKLHEEVEQAPLKPGPGPYPMLDLNSDPGPDLEPDQ